MNHKHVVCCTLLISILVAGLAACSSQLTQKPPAAKTPEHPTALLVEGIDQPLNVHNPSPTLSWHANVKHQTHYQIQVARSEPSLINGKADLWDSGKIPEQRSRNIPYQGQSMSTRERVVWRVRVWEKGSSRPSRWSPVSHWEMGLLNKQDWQASWLQPAKRIVTHETPAVSKWIDLVSTIEFEDGRIASPAKKKVEQMPTASLFRHNFVVSKHKQLVSAKIHSTAAGYYELFINGKRVKDRIMDPGQTDFDKRILYNTDDVRHFINQGDNVIGVHLGSGWYNEDIAFTAWVDPDKKKRKKPKQSLSFGDPSFITQLELEFSDGTKQVVTSNENWLSHPSPTLKEGIFAGELYDASKQVNHWNSTVEENKLTNWQPVNVLDEWPTQQLEPQFLPPIRAIKRVDPIRIFSPKANTWVFDFGQNFTAVPSLHLELLKLSSGNAVHLRFAEWADESGNISQLSSGSWATKLNPAATYIAGKQNPSSWTPSFMWTGFRYIEVTGLEQAPPLAALSAHLVRSDVAIAGTFESSDPLINRIHHTALWTYESNLMSVPLDCPIREKAGWTGDAHAALVTGNYSYNMENFWSKYLGDFRTALHTAPTVVPGKRTGAGKVDWAAAEVFIAWEHFRHHGNHQVLAKQYESLTEYMNYGQSQMSDFLIREGYGDWCDPVTSPGTPRVGGRGTPQWTSTTVTSTALFTRAADLMSKIAAVLDKNDDSRRYKTLFENMRTGFHGALYDTDTGHYGSQTADAMALRFNITPFELRQSVADALHKDVTEKWKGHSSVGALGQTWLYLALSDYGYTDTAFQIFKAKGYPGFSYLFNELNGTTLWERKGAYDPSSGRGPIRSLSHPFHSGYDGWFYQGLGGIRPLEDSIGFQEFMLKPVFPSELNSVNVNYDSGYGNISSRWERKADGVHWSFTIPNNTHAWVDLPDRKKRRFGPGSYLFVVKQ